MVMHATITNNLLTCYSLVRTLIHVCNFVPFWRIFCVQLFRNVNSKSLIVHLLWLAGLIIFLFHYCMQYVGFCKAFSCFLCG